MQDDDRHATPEKGLWGDPSPKRTVFMDSSPGGPPSGGDPFLEPLHGWGTGRASHSPAVMASPTAVSMELTGGSQGWALWPGRRHDRPERPVRRDASWLNRCAAPRQPASLWPAPLQ